MAEVSEIEKLQSKLVGLIVSLEKVKLKQLCDLFKISATDIENKTRLTLTTLFIAEIEKQLSVLKQEEIIPYLNDCIEIAEGETATQKEVGIEAEQARIKELEASIAALKIQQEKELEAARERLETARKETGVSAEGSSIEKSSMENLKSILRREFRIVGVLGPQAMKENLSFMSLNRQIEEGLKRGYEEKEVIDGIIKCISSSLPLKDYIEAMRESGLETINKILRAHFQEKNASELYASLTNLVQNANEEPQNFLLRALNLREKVIFASKAENAKVKYESAQCQSMFLHAVETGLISNTLRTRMRTHLQRPDVTDAELINELNVAVTEESERNLKLGLGQKGKAKVNQVQSTTDEKSSVKELVAEIKALKGEMATLREEVKKNKGQGEAQGKNQAGVVKGKRRGCEKCRAEGCGDSCRHCWKCGDGGHLSYNCHKAQGNFPRLLSRDRQ